MITAEESFCWAGPFDLRESALTKRFILLDRDGTLIKEKHYLSRPEQVELIPGAAAALRTLREMGWGVILITNQSGLGRGFFSRADLDHIHLRLMALLREENASLDGIYFCPHLPEEGCKCRKPLLGLVYQAVMDHGFDPKGCVVVGDKACDLEMGRRLGGMTCLVRTGYGRNYEESDPHLADYVLDSISELPVLIKNMEAA